MKVYTLNEEGKRQVLDFIRAHGNERVLEALDNTRAADSWFDSVGDDGHLEMQGRYTSTGNPITVTFGPECFDSEEIPED